MTIFLSPCHQNRLLRVLNAVSLLYAVMCLLCVFCIWRDIKETLSNSTDACTEGYICLTCVCRQLMYVSVFDIWKCPRWRSPWSIKVSIFAALSFLWFHHIQSICLTTLLRVRQTDGLNRWLTQFQRTHVAMSNLSLASLSRPQTYTSTSEKVFFKNLARGWDRTSE